ncbi:MAG: terminase small subunit [Clostridia bacterium]|nr:terminase small subunit [Clostridia bacterium]
MKNQKKLSTKEELFCLYFSSSRDPRGSAAKAGYTLFPERSAEKLLASSAILKRLDELQQQRRASLAEVTEGYRKLAFGSIADAISLITAEQLPTKQELEKLDLSMISDIKCPKSGGLEIKFFDRLKALDKLCEISSAVQNESSSDFLSALEKSARALHSDGENGE